MLLLDHPSQQVTELNTDFNLGYQHASQRARLHCAETWIGFMKLARALCASQRVAISIDLLGLHSAQNFISRLPHGVQTRYKRTNGSLFGIGLFITKLAVLPTITIPVCRQATADRAPSQKESEAAAKTQILRVRVTAVRKHGPHDG
jgi:hypothetical protein